MANMKVVAMFLLAMYLRCANAKDQSYSTQYDGVNIEEILANDRLLTGYVNCLLDNGPCSPDGKELKKNLPDAIQNDCMKCSDRQREGADQVLDYIIDHRLEDWEKLEKKYNSDGSYKKKYLARKEAQSSTTEANKTAENEKEKSNETQK